MLCCCSPSHHPRVGGGPEPWLLTLPLQGILSIPAPGGHVPHGCCGSRWTQPATPGHGRAPANTPGTEEVGSPRLDAHKLQKEPNQNQVFLQYRQGHLAEILHLEICSEGPNKAPFSDFEHLYIQSGDSRQARAHCIITHPRKDVCRGHALLQAPPTQAALGSAST